MISKYKYLIIFLFCSFHFYGLHYRIHEFLYFLFDAIGFCLLIGSQFLEVKKKPFRKNFKKLLLLLFFFLIISAISASFFHQQSFFKTIVAMRYIFYLFGYFLFTKFNIDNRKIYEAIKYGCIFYMIVFSIQFLIFPQQIVNVGRIEEFDRGVLRFRIEGIGFVMLFGLWNLNYYLLRKNKKEILIYIICLAFIYLLGFRTLLLTAIFSSFFLIYKVKGSSSSFYFIVAGFLMLLVYQIPFVQNYITEAIDLTVEQADDSDSYVRVLAYNFYFGFVNANEYTLLLGNGFPQEESQYGSYIINTGKERYGYIIQDLGLIGFSFMYGIISTILYVIIAVKAIFIKLPKQAKFLNAYFLYLLVSSFTTTEIYRIGILGIIGLSLYLIDSFYNTNNMIKKQ